MNKVISIFRIVVPSSMFADWSDIVYTGIRDYDLHDRIRVWRERNGSYTLMSSPHSLMALRSVGVTRVEVLIMSAEYDPN